MKTWIKALLLSILIISIIHVLAYIATGFWTIGVNLQSGTMEPNMHAEDLILVQSAQRTNIITYEEGKTLNYRSLNDYGDVILYDPNGVEGVTPILHRAMYYVEQGEPMWQGGPPAPNAGYITKGDNNRTNPAYDQMALLGPDGQIIKPVKKEWVVAVARARVPFLGYLGLLSAYIVYALIYIIIYWTLGRKGKHISAIAS